MKPASPVIPGYEDREYKLGEKQPQFQTLPAIFAGDQQGTVISRWTLDDQDLERIQETRELYISQLTFGNQFQPVLPSAEPLPVPDPAPAKQEEERSPRIWLESRVIPLSRETGNPVLPFESAPSTWIDIAGLCSALLVAENAVGDEVPEAAIKTASADPSAELQKTIEKFVSNLARTYGADVYYRIAGDETGRWLIREGELESGIHTGRTERPFSREEVERGRNWRGVVDVAVLDPLDNVEPDIARRMIRATVDRFPGPYYLLGFADATVPDRIAEFSEEYQGALYTSLSDAIDECERLIKPNGPFCAFIGTERGTFLMDSRIWTKGEAGENGNDN